MPYKELLVNMPPEEQNKMQYPDLCALRAAAFSEHVTAMVVPTILKEWAAIMRARFGDQVKVWHVLYDSWLVALMVVRYGEAIEHWPEQFSDDDVRRARAWEGGQKPGGVTYPVTTSGPKLACIALIALAGLTYVCCLSEWAIGLCLVPLFASALTDYMENDLAKHLFRTGVTTLSAWAASTAYSAGDIVRASTWNNRIFQCVVAGTSGGSEPTWDTDIGDETTDNTVTWLTCAVGVPKRAHWMALFTAAPGETGGGTEVSGGSYARTRLTPLDANWNAPSGGNGLIDNAVAIVFPTPSANWGTVSHWADLERASGSANYMIHGALTQAKTVNNGDPAPQFQAGALDLTWA